MPDMNVHGQLYSGFKSEHAVNNEQTRLYAACAFYMIYGSIFLAAWKFEFPTIPEMWLWRASSLVLVSYGPAVFLTMAIRIPFMSAAIFTKVRAKFHKAGKKTWFLDIVKVFLLAVISITWAFARWYIAVESVISLRKVPAGTYETVNWTNRIPHIT